MDNLYEHPTIKKFVKKVNNPAFENTQIEVNSRVVFDGGTGSGKTSAVIDYILKTPNTYEQIIVIYQGIPEPFYEALEEKLGKKGKVTFFTADNYPTCQELSARRENQKTDQYLVIFDDMIAELNTKKDIKKIKEYFIYGRKLFLTTFFLTQDYHSVPKVIRGQMSHLILLKLSSDSDLAIILKNFRLGVTREQLEEMYSIATTGQFNFLKIHTTGTDMDKKFTRNWTDEFRVVKTSNGYGPERSVVLAGPWLETVGMERRAPKRKSQPEQERKKRQKVEDDEDDDDDVDDD